MILNKVLKIFYSKTLWLINNIKEYQNIPVVYISMYYTQSSQVFLKIDLERCLTTLERFWTIFKKTCELCV